MPSRGIVAATTRSRLAPEKTPSARSEPAIIEMFGVPGVGKTTLVAAVIQNGYQLTRQELTAAWTRRW